ncbi:MAG: bifunctional UDP-3-O-[3-hydroxymyristoyl] N-acetylglucosamine deacetylase/3-hydroxyacyl-ACP dehydratase [Bacteroidetes bacterium]|nr:bifunctional UDP-3-O-[3-hydroxymyristoyl] N-acetylglucosamine deacetylase/3-hydroxyacyl-ACP dehydratase [Bacteroidota bacterium]MBT3934556.1 bifunctional UDP-3-O-[3-hydroxymyristoyl] N-acetylglucosamine deacetylase/3-hydroxyacyl-ACP dehydratase [Bacteroidota bacterium]MBT4337959.1 bifunctional UDP-3-O-[3-hydroxymyristoyl] N-acetylglucosamine deacetylase/3-hydroxyacyl-ACP dehydratase [Bacteroidota bacterium]MBT4727196.1 bifunctional UDP-3-O-[3-hydroxymyristoyl] N-acetylglucosamine deacetylase/
MELKQRTITRAVSISGVGLHTGQRVNLTFNPAPENHGYKFQRVDLEDKPIIEADVDLVVSTDRGTKLAKNGVEVGTVEHCLASLAGLSIDNVLIELDGPEVPIMDGSALHFVKALHDAGIKEQLADREYFEISSNVYYSNKDSDTEMIAMPLDSFRATVMIDYNSPILGSQHASITQMQEFESEIANCRTFCLLHEIESMFNNNLIKGGDVDNAIVVVDRFVPDEELEKLAKMFNKQKNELRVEEGGILNNLELHHHNEPARHKLLDLIGDLALVGMPIKAQIMAARCGHTTNIEFAKKIKKAIALSKKQNKNNAPQYDPNAKPVFNTVEIEKILPHRHPFLFVDKIIDLTDKHVTGIKNVTYDESFFRGHFPGDPVMPGVLMIEALAQCGGVLILSNVPDPENYSTYFMKIDNAKFKDKVLPGDTLVMKCELTQAVRRGICVMKGQAFVGNKLVVEADLMASIVKNT